MLDIRNISPGSLLESTTDTQLLCIETGKSISIRLGQVIMFVSFRVVNYDTLEDSEKKLVFRSIPKYIEDFFDKHTFILAKFIINDATRTILIYSVKNNNLPKDFSDSNYIVWFAKLKDFKEETT